MMERAGIEIDYCPQCRGVWLDRGELDKVIERSAMAGVRSGERRRDDDDDYREDLRRYEEGRRYDESGSYGGGRRRRDSFLDDLFDFG
jgi:Zn-finger nucleic acid-binding protein